MTNQISKWGNYKRVDSVRKFTKSMRQVHRIKRVTRQGQQEQIRLGGSREKSCGESLITIKGVSQIRQQWVQGNPGEKC